MGGTPLPPPRLVPTLGPWADPKCARHPRAQLEWVCPRSARSSKSAAARRAARSCRRLAMKPVRSCATGGRVRATGVPPWIDHAAWRQSPRPRQTSSRTSRTVGSPDMNSSPRVRCHSAAPRQTNRSSSGAVCRDLPKRCRRALRLDRGRGGDRSAEEGHCLGSWPASVRGKRPR